LSIIFSLFDLDKRELFPAPKVDAEAKIKTNEKTFEPKTDETLKEKSDNDDDDDSSESDEEDSEEKKKKRKEKIGFRDRKVKSFFCILKSKVSEFKSE